MVLDMNISSDGTTFLHHCSIYKAKFAFIASFPPKEYYINYVILCVVNFLLAFSSTFLNSITVLAYWRSSLLKKKKSYFVIMLLSVSDLAVGLLSNSTFVVLMMCHLLGFGSCSFTAACVTVTYTFPCMSLATLIILNIERYLGIVHPIFHRNKTKKSTYLTAAVILWFVSTMFISILFINEHVARVLLSSTIGLILIILVFIYVSIFLVGRRVHSAIRSPTDETTNRKETLRKIALGKSCLIVVCCTLLCSLPVALSNSLHKRTPNGNAFVMWGHTLLFSASTFNSVIFFWRNKLLRNEARKIVFRCI